MRAQDTRFGMAFCVSQKRMPKRNPFVVSFLGFRTPRVPLAPAASSTPGYFVPPLCGATRRKSKNRYTRPLARPKSFFDFRPSRIASESKYERLKGISEAV
jgi:hypothetical protein